MAKPHIHFTSWKHWEVSYKGFVVIVADDIATVKGRWSILMSWIDFYEGQCTNV